MTPGFTDAWKQAQENPGTFQLPDLTDIKVGGHVKVCHSNERFWIWVESLADQVITGRVVNHLIQAPFEVLDVVRVEFRHVYDIDNRSNEDGCDSEVDNIRGIHDSCNKSGSEH